MNYRDFEFEFDVSELLEYETSAKTALGTVLVDFVSLDRFPTGSAVIPSALKPVLRRIAHLLVASVRIGMEIRHVDIGGYVDTSGSDRSSGDLGRKRAEAVRDEIVTCMKEVGRDSIPRVNFNLSSGATAPIQTRDHALNRRVVVRLPRTCQVFFAEYDLWSFNHDVLGFNAHPQVIDKLGRSNNLVFVGQELEARLNKRAEQALAGKILPAQPRPLSIGDMGTVRKGIDDLSKMQLELFKKYHPKFPDFATDSLMNCLLTFANGQLRSPHVEFDSGKNEGRVNFGVGEPDSNHVFMFAEFAFLCIDWNLPTAGSWARALPAMVAAQEVFMHVYRKNPRSPPPPLNAPLAAIPVASPTHLLSDFGARHFRQIGSSQTTGAGQSSAARLSEVAAKYTRLIGTEQLRAAMTTNLLRAQTLT